MSMIISTDYLIMLARGNYNMLQDFISPVIDN
jgi:hypothetical protein